jgi:hypothetical protein
MNSAALQSHPLQSSPVDVDPGGPIDVTLKDAIGTAQPTPSAAIKHRTSCRGLRGAWCTWLWGVQTAHRGFCRRFLWTALLDDPRGILRARTSVLKTPGQRQTLEAGLGLMVCRLPYTWQSDP